MRYLDAFGREIKRGDVIVYPGRHGSSMNIVKARVLDFSVHTNYLNIQEPVLKVWRIQENRGKRSELATKPVLNATSITRLDLCTVIEGGPTA